MPDSLVMPQTVYELHQEAARRFGCTLRLGGREFDASGSLVGRGEACANCVGCDNPTGEVGLIAEGVALVRKNTGQLQARWKCPVCGGSVHEDVPEWEKAAAVADEVLGDPMCWGCRKKLTNKGEKNV